MSMQSIHPSQSCPECCIEVVDVGDELVCPACGIVKEKEVIELRRSGPPVATDFTDQALGSYLGSANMSSRERFSKGFSKCHSTYGYLKVISDYAGRDDGATYECAKMIERVNEKLSLPKVVMAQAVLIARKLLASKERSRRVTLATLSAFALIVSSRIAGITSVSTKEVLEAHRSLGRRVKVSSLIQLSLDSQIRTQPRRPEDYLSKVLAKLSQNVGLSEALVRDGVGTTSYFNALREMAREILGLVDEDLKAGHRPCALAATAVYAADLLLAERESRGRRITQRDVAECGDAAEYTVREQYRQIFTPSLLNSRLGLKPRLPALIQH